MLFLLHAKYQLYSIHLFFIKFEKLSFGPLDSFSHKQPRKGFCSKNVALTFYVRYHSHLYEKCLLAIPLIKQMEDILKEPSLYGSKNNLAMVSNFLVNYLDYKILSCKLLSCKLLILSYVTDWIKRGYNPVSLDIRFYLKNVGSFFFTSWTQTRFFWIMCLFLLLF